MGDYGLGVDLGTTQTAAALMRPDGQRDLLTLGSRSATVATVVYLGLDGVAQIGEAAERRALTEPERVAREFKRRVGDTAPVILGGQPWPPEVLLATVLRWVLARAGSQEGGPPAALVVTHPANWGPLRRELFEAAVAQPGVPTTFATEPEAAAIHYASATRVPDGTVVAVYDLGGGTFDATVLRKTGDGFELLGRPEGIERLGGLDFDEAVFARVTGLLGNAWDRLDPLDPATAPAVAALRETCVRAKEALSEDTDVAVNVQLPTAATRLRLTRYELEEMIRPSIERSAESLERAIVGAGLTAEQVDRILLVGGSSRIPLVSEMLAGRFGRPLAVDAHPKHSVAHGAARLAVDRAAAATPPAAVTPPVPAPPVEAPPPVEPPVVEPVEPVEPTARRPRKALWVGVGVAVIAVAAAGTALLLGGDDGGGAADDQFERPESEFVSVADDLGLIEIDVPERWTSIGGEPFVFEGTSEDTADLVAAVDEEAFQVDGSTTAGVNFTLMTALVVEELGVDVGDVAGLTDGISPCTNEPEVSDASIDEFEGELQIWQDCLGFAAVQVFGGFDGGGRGLTVLGRLDDSQDEADFDDVLDSATITG